jgi:hypothetical protein
MPAQPSRQVQSRQKIARFGALPLAIIADCSIDPVAKVILMFLAAHMGHAGAWPGLDTIAGGIGRDVGTVRRHLADLRDAGLLTWQHEMRGGRRMAVFWFTFDRFASLHSLRQDEPTQLGQDELGQDEPTQLGQDELGQDEPTQLGQDELGQDEPTQLGQDEPTQLGQDELGQVIAKNKTGGDRSPVHGPNREHKTNPPNPPLQGGGRRAGERIEPGVIRIDREIRELLTGQEGAAGEKCDCCQGLIMPGDLGLVWSRWGDALPNVIRIQHVDRYKVELRSFYLHQKCIDVETRRHICVTVRK